MADDTLTYTSIDSPASASTDPLAIAALNFFNRGFYFIGGTTTVQCSFTSQDEAYAAVVEMRSLLGLSPLPPLVKPK
jgi:hypothetical protein